MGTIIHSLAGGDQLAIGDMLAIRASVQKLSHDGFARDIDIANYKLDDADDYLGKSSGFVASRQEFQRNGHRTVSTMQIKWCRTEKHSRRESRSSRGLAGLPRQISLDAQLYYVNLKLGSTVGRGKVHHQRAISQALAAGGRHPLGSQDVGSL